MPQPPLIITGRRINDEYKIHEPLGSGAFGQVYSVISRSGQLFAAKFTPLKEAHYSSNEYHAMRWMKYQNDSEKTLHPRPYWYGKHYNHMVLVMTLLGRSVDDAFATLHKDLSPKTILMFAYQGLNRIEDFHSVGYVHCDIKPDNFLLGGPNRSDRNIYLVDFNISVRFKVNNTHVSKTVDSGFRGTNLFAGLDAHRGYKLSRRSDLESFAYSLAYLVKGRLPWSGFSHDFNEVFRRKERVRSSALFGSNAPSCYAKYFAYVRRLGYYEKPNYSYCRRLFKTSLTNRGLRLDYDYDWV